MRTIAIAVGLVVVAAASVADTGVESLSELFDADGEVAEWAIRHDKHLAAGHVGDERNQRPAGTARIDEPGPSSSPITSSSKSGRFSTGPTQVATALGVLPPRQSSSLSKAH